MLFSQKTSKTINIAIITRNKFKPTINKSEENKENIKPQYSLENIAIPARKEKLRQKE